MDGGYEFYFDECVLGAAKRLREQGFEVLHPDHPAIPQLRYGSADTAWMPEVARLGLIGVTRDRRINQRLSERLIVREAGLRVVWFGGSKDMTPGEQAALFLRHVERIRRTAIKQGAGPWGLKLTDRSVKPVHLTH